ncbi:MAG: SCP2 sterol-binding domain-containing protein [Deltaproteobacteria bacterium]|nr:SCP2 sterol-binding domain-containing protein [Deltaproteobacteria bacterium]
MEGPMISLSFSLDEIMVDFIPKMATAFLAISGASGALSGTEASLVLDVEGRAYSFTAKDASSVTARLGDMERPTARVSMSISDLVPLINPKNADMLLVIPTSLTREKYDLVNKLGGEARFELKNEDGSVSVITAVFNGKNSPRATLALDITEARKMFARQSNPVEMFMKGSLKITGDIAFAMTLQPLFT